MIFFKFAKKRFEMLGEWLRYLVGRIVTLESLYKITLENIRHRPVNPSLATIICNARSSPRYSIIYLKNAGYEIVIHQTKTGDFSPFQVKLIPQPSVPKIDRKFKGQKLEVLTSNPKTGQETRRQKIGISVLGIATRRTRPVGDIEDVEASLITAGVFTW